MKEALTNKLPVAAPCLGAQASRPHKHWHSRGYLPHRDTPGLLQAITFRLADSLPRDVLERLAEETDDAQRREQIEALLDSSLGECWLGRPEVAIIVEEALLHFDGQRYRLLAWCVMPNHVHVLVETMREYPLGGLVHSWKSYTAKAINKHLGRSGAVWREDYHDRYIRNRQHFDAAVAYIEGNPVKAGLVEKAEEWRSSSAYARKNEGFAAGTAVVSAALPRAIEERGEAAGTAAVSAALPRAMEERGEAAGTAAVPAALPRAMEERGEAAGTAAVSAALPRAMEERGEAAGTAAVPGAPGMAALSMGEDGRVVGTSSLPRAFDAEPVCEGSSIDFEIKALLERAEGA